MEFIGRDKDGNSHIHHYVRQDEKSMMCLMCEFVYELTEEQQACGHCMSPNQLTDIMGNSYCQKCRLINPFRGVSEVVSQNKHTINSWLQ